VTQVVNFLQTQPGWANTLVVIAYDDSDGWYDHQSSPIVNPSSLTSTLANFISNGISFTGLGDWLNGAGVCSSGTQQGTNAPSSTLLGATGTANIQGRCGYGPRLPLLVISPYAKVNYVDHTLTDQTSILRFIEDNWLGGQRITGSFDSIAGSLTNMLNLTSGGSTPSLYLDPSSGQAIPCATCN
jgi:phospholipase C